MSDAPLLDRVHVALLENPHLPRRTWRLETEEGRVVLRGMVHSWYQKQMAQATLLRVEGARCVENRLEVGNPVRDEAPAERLFAAAGEPG